MTDLHYEISVDGRAQVMRPESRRRLAEATTRTLCTDCGRAVPATDRAVVVVDGQPRVFHLRCADTGVIRLQLEARTSRAYARHAAAQARIDAARREVV